MDPRVTRVTVSTDDRNRAALSEHHFIFLQGIKVRSGTNYIAQIAACHPLLQIAPPRRAGKPGAEFPLVKTLPSWRASFDLVRKGYIGDKELDFHSFARYQGDCWLRFMVDTFDLKSGYIFIKDPATDGLDLFFDAFPNERLIVLLRDGRDNTASAVKAGMAVRKGIPAAKTIRRRASHLIMRDFVSHARSWARSAQRIIEFDNKFRETRLSDQYMIIRYEDVFANPRAISQALFDFIGIGVDEQVLSAVENVGVVGSSYYSQAQREDAMKPNWSPTPRTEAFQPIARWKQWGSLQKLIFKRVAGRELISLGYANDLDW